MRRFLLASTFLAAIGVAPAFSQTLHVEIFDDSTLIGQGTSSTGTLTVLGSDTNFKTVQITADGPPVLPAADLSTDTLSASTATGFTGTHKLTVDIFQIGVAATGKVSSTFTANALVGTPGPTLESQYTGGTMTTLGAFLDSAAFAAGVTNGSAGPLFSTLGFFSADAQQYVISFNAGSESFSGTQQLETTIPEPGTWALTLSGFGVMAGWVAWRRRRPMRYAFVD
jgi:hypothetical protein